MFASTLICMLGNFYRFDRLNWENPFVFFIEINKKRESTHIEYVIDTKLDSLSHNNTWSGPFYVCFDAPTQTHSQPTKMSCFLFFCWICNRNGCYKIVYTIFAIKSWPHCVVMCQNNSWNCVFLFVGKSSLVYVLIQSFIQIFHGKKINSSSIQISTELCTNITSG